MQIHGGPSPMLGCLCEGIARTGPRGRASSCRSLALVVDTLATCHRRAAVMMQAYLHFNETYVVARDIRTKLCTAAGTRGAERSTGR